MFVLASEGSWVGLKTVCDSPGVVFGLSGKLSIKLRLKSVTLLVMGGWELAGGGVVRRDGRQLAFAMQVTI